MFSKEKFWQGEQEGTTANKYQGIFTSLYWLICKNRKNAFKLDMNQKVKGSPVTPLMDLEMGTSNYFSL